LWRADPEGAFIAVAEVDKVGVDGEEEEERIACEATAAV
jgi:hypothetical protein